MGNYPVKIVPWLEASMSQATDSVRDYLKSIGRLPLLNPEEEVKLGKAVQKMMACLEVKQQWDSDGQELSREQWAVEVGCTETELAQILESGKQAKDRMVSANLRLVVSIAKQYQGRGLDLLDLIQEGSLGLMRAVEKFEPTKGYKFSTYAYWWIRQSMMQGIADKKQAIRFPLHIIEKLNRLKKVSREFDQKLGRPPTVKELSCLMDSPSEDILSLLSLNRPIVSLDLMVGEEDNSCLGDFLADPQQDLHKKLETLLSQEWVRELLADFSEQERTVIARRYFVSEPEKYRDIGKKLNLSRERVRQIHEKALKKLRCKLRKGGQLRGSAVGSYF
jgi:RNA polymerase nonessential primary-like sigma factor